MGKRSRRLLITTTVPQTLDAFVVPQVPYLLKAGWQVMLVASPDGRSVPGVSGVTTQEIRMTRSISPIPDARAWVEWLLLLRKAKPDVLLGSTPKAGLLAMTAGAVAGVEHRIFLHRGARWETLRGNRRLLIMELERLTMTAATANLAVSDSLADLVFSEGLVKSRPIVLGHGGSAGVDLDRFSVAPVTHDRPATIGFVGRISRDKGVDVALAVLSALRQSFANPTLIVAGELDPNDPIDESTKQRLEWDSDVRLLGRVEDIPGFMHGIDVLVFPSRREGLPNVVIEAAACGVPTVAWDVTGVRDAISDGRTGSLVPFGRVALFNRQVAYWVNRRNPSTARQCREWSTRFARDELAGTLVRFLDNLLEPSSANSDLA